MTGLIPKTSGHVYVGNEDNVEFYRSKIGYCPQHNISLPYLTCQEHLEFFGQLRGLSKFNSEVEAKNILMKVNLQSKAGEVAKRLSGGMLRKLCLANAIIGDTKLLILGESTRKYDRFSLFYKHSRLKFQTNHRVVSIRKVDETFGTFCSN